MRFTTRRNLILIGAACLGLAFGLSGCKPQNAQARPVSVLVGPAKTEPAAAEQTAGYQELSKALDLNLKIGDSQIEPAQPDEVQVMVRSMAEKDKAVAILGATSNEASMRAAGLVNFLNLPMLIPTAGGDNLMPSNNLWAFRLSAPGSAYGRYLFGQIVTKSAVSQMHLDTDVLESFKIAILYEQNTFGESAAVATAQTAMQQSIEIDPLQSLYGMQIAVYGSFPDRALDAERIKALVGQVKENGVQLVYLVASDNAIAAQLVRAFVSAYAADQTPLPILVGQSGAFASAAFEQSTEAKDVYILRQFWDKKSCPAGITSLYAGQSYAAAYLLNQSVRFVLDSTPQTVPSLAQKSSADQLSAFRESLREKLKDSQLNLPCLGMVSFDTNGQNKNLQFEFVKVDAGAEKTVSVEQFLEILRARILDTAF